jgi:hypothetical protein
MEKFERALSTVRDKIGGWARLLLIVVLAVSAAYLTLVMFLGPIKIPVWLRAPLQVGATVSTALSAIFLERQYEQNGLRTIKFFGLSLWLYLSILLGYFAIFAPIDAKAVVAQGSLLIAYGDEGQVAWARSLPSNIVKHSSLSDLDGDDVSETVVATEDHEGRGSRVVVIDENGNDVCRLDHGNEVCRLDLSFEVREPGGLDRIPLVYVDYSSITFEVADILVRDLDGREGQEILLLANDPGQRGAPSLILGLKANGELAAWYWHFGRLRTVRVLQTSGSEKGPLIVVLAENPLLADDGYASVAFALFGTEFFTGGGPMCWNLTTTVASNYPLAAVEDLERLYDADDLGVLMGCRAFDVGALAWYGWVEPSDVTIEEMSIGWVKVCHRMETYQWCETRRLVSLALSDGCALGIDQFGKRAPIATTRLSCRSTFQSGWSFIVTP